MIVFAQLRNALRRAKLRRQIAVTQKSEPVRVLGFYEASGTPIGRALVIYSPESLQRFREQGNYRFFNPDGAMVQIWKALNECGFTVDAIGIRDTEFRLTHDYDILVAHAGPAYCHFGELVRPNCKVLDYSTGCHWRAFNAQSADRYARFGTRQTGTKSQVVARPLVIDHEDYAAKRGDLIVCLGPETARTFEPFGKRVFHVNNAAINETPAALPPITESLKRSFLYCGGSGNVQKGLDLLVEAFAQEPDLHLHIDSPIEDEMLAAYKKELRSPNIHYVEWWRKLPGGAARIPRRCAFTVYAGFNSGQSTALIGSLGDGLIPVVTREANLGLGPLEVAIHSPSVTDIRAAIRRASQLPIPELETRRTAVLAAFQKEFSPAAYRGGFKTAIASLQA